MQRADCLNKAQVGTLIALETCSREDGAVSRGVCVFLVPAGGALASQHLQGLRGPSRRCLQKAPSSFPQLHY